MRTREDKADLGPPGDRGVRVTRSLGWGWDPPGVALTPGARVARHAHRHHVRHSGHVRRQRLRARRCVARPHRARASPRGAPRGVANLDIVPPFFPSATSRGTIMTTSDAPRVAPRSAPISRPDLVWRLTTLPRALASLPPQPPRRSAPTPPGTRARERRPRSSSEARLRHRRDDASWRETISRSLPLRPLPRSPRPRVSLTARAPLLLRSSLRSLLYHISGPRLRSARSRRGRLPSPRRRWRTRRAPCTRSPPSSARRR